MICFDKLSCLKDFQQYARYFIHHKTAPTEINWGENSKTLFDDYLPLSKTQDMPPVNMPKEFVSMAKKLMMLRGDEKWNLLYKIMYRLLFENRNLLQIPSDKDMREANLYMKSIGRDIHKMHAFVRFKRAPTKEESYIAWHKPEHLILRAGVPFFVERFGDKPWSILTPDESAHWDGEKLSFSEGVELHDFHVKDDWDEVWKDYCKSIYNPARLNVKMMKQEMSPKYWSSMPESEIIQELIRETPALIEKNQKAQWTEAQVPEHSSLNELNTLLKTCRACPLYQNNQEVVIGEGSEKAKVLILGEGPSELLDQYLFELGIKREEVYVTHILKHFKEGKPSGREVHACRPWLEAEIDLIRPKVILALGVVAATSVLGRRPNIAKERGIMFSNRYAENIFVTWGSRSFQEKREHILEDFKRLATYIPNS